MQVFNAIAIAVSELTNDYRQTDGQMDEVLAIVFLLLYKGLKSLCDSKYILLLHGYQLLISNIFTDPQEDYPWQESKET